MAITIRIVDNDDERYPGMILIEQDDNGVISRSWAAADIPPEARLSIDHPQAIDARTGARSATPVAWKMPSSDVWLRMDPNYDGKAEERRLAYRDTAAAAGLDVSEEADLVVET